MKRICAVLALALLLTGCGAAAPAPELTPAPEPVKPKEVLFGSDEVVNGFLIAYNSAAEIPIPAEEVERGNIKTKALVYIDDLYFEIIHVEGFSGDNPYISLMFGVAPENERTKLLAVFRDVIAAVRPEITAEDVGAAWEELHESGYGVQDYALEDILIDYFPDLGTVTVGPKKPRIDMKIPLNEEA